MWTKWEDTGEERPASEVLSVFLPHVQRHQGTETSKRNAGRAGSSLQTTREGQTYTKQVLFGLLQLSA